MIELVLTMAVAVTVAVVMTVTAAAAPTAVTHQIAHSLARFVILFCLLSEKLCERISRIHHKKGTENNKYEAPAQSPRRTHSLSLSLPLSLLCSEREKEISFHHIYFIIISLALRPRKARAKFRTNSHCAGTMWRRWAGVDACASHRTQRDNQHITILSISRAGFFRHFIFGENETIALCHPSTIICYILQWHCILAVCCCRGELALPDEIIISENVAIFHSIISSTWLAPGRRTAQTRTLAHAQCGYHFVIGTPHLVAAFSSRDKLIHSHKHINSSAETYHIIWIYYWSTGGNQHTHVYRATMPLRVICGLGIDAYVCAHS